MDSGMSLVLMAVVGLHGLVAPGDPIPGGLGGWRWRLGGAQALCCLLVLKETWSTRSPRR